MNLTKDVLTYIFSFCERKELGILCRTCRQFREYIDPMLSSWEALFHAVKIKDRERTRHLIETRKVPMDDDTEDRYSFVLVYEAVANDDESMVEYLLLSGAKPTVESWYEERLSTNQSSKYPLWVLQSCFKNSNAMQEACTRGNETIVSLLLDHGVHLEEANSFLELATQKKLVKVTEILLNNGANPDGYSESPFDSFPIHYSIVNNDLQTFNLLLSYGASVRLDSGWNALFHACEWNRTEMVKILLSTHDGDRRELDYALMCACKNGNAELVECLLKRGASPNGYRYENVGCLDVARMRNDGPTMRLIEGWRE